jgi:DNA-binding transcriptional LysR family regulator
MTQVARLVSLVSDSTPTHPFDVDSPNLKKRAIDDEKLLSGTYWGELRTFLAIAKSKSLTHAAENLNTSHTTVGRELRRLQDRMGAHLAVVSKSGVKLTERGQTLAQALLRFDQEMFAITNDLRAETRSAEGVVRVSITDGLGIAFLAPALVDFKLKYPKLQVHIKSPGNFQNLRENQTDLMIGFASERDQDLSSTPLGYLQFLPIACRNYVERHGLPTRQSVGQHFFVDSEIYASQNPLWSPWRKLVSQGTISGFADASITYGMMVKSGLGIGLLANYTTIEPSVVPLDLDCCVSIGLHLVAIKERLESKPVRVVADLLRELFSPANPWFDRIMNLECGDSRFNDGIKRLFNLEE